MSNILTLIWFLALFTPQSVVAQQTWKGLAVAPENRCSDYDKKEQYPYPQSVEDEIVASMDGKVYGPYTGRYFASDTLTDIEHIVAASEGHDSGLCAASTQTRRKFATDLLNLTLAAPEINRCNTGGKCGYDAAEWLPDTNKCWFANRIIEIKLKYQLSIDIAEKTALETVLNSCESPEMVFHSEQDFVNDDVVQETQSVLDLFDDNNNGKISCVEARAHGIVPVKRGHPAYQFMYDRDGDGTVCK